MKHEATGCRMHIGARVVYTPGCHTSIAKLEPTDKELISRAKPVQTTMCATLQNKQLIPRENCFSSENEISTKECSRLTSLVSRAGSEDDDDHTDDDDHIDDNKNDYNCITE